MFEINYYCRSKIKIRSDNFKIPKKTTDFLIHAKFFLCFRDKQHVH